MICLFLSFIFIFYYYSFVFVLHVRFFDWFKAWSTQRCPHTLFVTSEEPFMCMCKDLCKTPRLLSSLSRGVFRGLAPGPSCGAENIVLIFNVKKYASFWAVLKMYAWNVPLGPSFQISKYATELKIKKICTCTGMIFKLLNKSHSKSWLAVLHWDSWLQIGFVAEYINSYTGSLDSYLWTLLNCSAVL